VDVRVIAATNKDPEQQVASKKFRQDLYYRLNVVRIHLPPLRERRSDIPVLVDYFLQKVGKAKTIAPETLALLVKREWSGNVRELENVIERAGVVARGDAVLPRDLPAESASPKPVTAGDVTGAIDAAVNNLFLMAKKDKQLKILPAVERELIIRALAETAGNQLQAAQLLGITRATLRKRIEKFGIQRRLELE
jgi:two-component system nitrogen regulation response regulator GlnG